MWYVMIALLLVLAILMLWFARRQIWESWTLEQANKEIYESRLLELEEDLGQGLISEKELILAKKELKKAFVTDVHDPDAAVSIKPVGFIVPSVLIAVLAVGIYVYDGSWMQQQRSDQAQEILPKLSEWLLGDMDAAPQTRDEMWTYALGLRQRLMDNPDANAWSLYGRMMMQLEQLEQALDAFSKSYEMDPNNYSNLMSYSQALIVSGTDQELNRAARFLGNVLQENPQNPEALGLLGIVNFERADFERAVQAWEMALMLMDESDPRYASIQSSLEQARERADGSVMTLVVTIDISETMRNELAPVNNVFLFVRDPDGGSAPIAVTRQRVTDFPITITLTDADAMLDNVNLSSAPSWLVQARVTTGDTMDRRSGDMEARPVLVERESGRQMRIVITEMIP
ncbi:cytochrome c-type biogenesis protein CcmI [Idiomarina sp. A28L]|uniref:c-type cytochrome biogenesis protein CcmI n=1 Tax=Idiomarina sp. A28L TaxID=1036674 RepID=UPI0002138D60|nr:c-type cytochrome biogenesis protein CcmI [Idiomarina sp. A28L]EGN74669.1 cytochrome c-type biogenesis protein CcmI [Idiomarina sp. A28L]